MRLRVCALACALATLGGLSAAGLASAAPHHNRNLTIAATPNPVLAGEGVLIYGQLSGPSYADQTIHLYHHISGSGRGYTLIGSTTTNSFGYYEFVRAEGVVLTNRSWFVRGPGKSHSRTVYEQVIPIVTLAASTSTTDTNHAVVFSGQVTPNHQFERVFLQQELGSSDDWRTLRATTLDRGSKYRILHRWARPGVHDVRVVFRGDNRNLPGASDSVTVNVEQAQRPGFTINSSAPIVGYEGAVTISGVLDGAGTNNPEPDTAVQLWGRKPDQRHFEVLANAITASDGGYSFTRSGLTGNEIYFVATAPSPQSPRRHTAVLYQGVRDMVTMQSSTSSAATGQVVTFTGTVLPDKAGHVIYLQKRDKDDGDWHTVKTRIVRHDSTFSFSWRLGAPGTYMVRARIPSDEHNVGAASPPVSVTATTPPPATLPPAS